MNRLQQLKNQSQIIIQKVIYGGDGMKTVFSKKLLSVFLCVALVMTYLPLSAISASAATNSTSVADPKTLSGWEDWFPVTSSRAAGSIFLDKSVYTASEAKQDDYFKLCAKRS